MDFILQIFDYLSGLGSYVMIPVMITLVGLVTKLKFSKAIKAGVTVGIGLVAIDITLSLVWNHIGPLAQIFVEKFGLGLTTIDVGWGVAAGMAFSTTVGSFIIPFIVLVNIGMLAFRLTRTLNIDIWNYWHYAFTGAVVNVVADNIVIAFIAAALHCIISLVIADRTAPKVQSALGLPGVSVAQGYAITTVPVFSLLEKLYDKIAPRKEQSKEQNVKGLKFFKWLQDPVMLGLVIGILLGISVGYTVKQILTVGMSMAALMLLLPRAVKVIMEGLLPISEQTKAFMQKKYNGEEFYIGLDSAILLGLPTTMSVGLILIPVTLILAAIIPWNTTIPLGDLAATAFFVSMATPIHKGSFWRTLISGTLMMVVVLSIASFFGPILTEFGSQSIPEGATHITGLSAGNWIAFALYQVSRLKWIGVAIAIAVTAVIVFFFGEKRKVNQGK